MFSENQIKALSYNLDESRVKTIDKAGMSFNPNYAIEISMNHKNL